MRYRFHPRPASLVATALILPVLVSLGFWQLDRAEQKRSLQAQYDRGARAAVRIDGALDRAAELQYRRVVARGHYDPGRQILIDNRVHAGQAGYHVITPLRLYGADALLLVNRGWIPAGPDRAHLPPAPVPAGLQEIAGVAITPPTEVFTLGAREQGWAQVWQYLDMARFQSLVPLPVQPVVILLDEQSEGGFVRAWPRPDAGVRTHQGYAFQWFALAVTLAVLFVALNLEMRGKEGR